MKGKKIALFVTILYLIVLVLCSSTLFWQGSIPELLAGLTKSVSFEEGVYKTSSTELKVKLHEGETELLSRFTQLNRADFRGSDNLDEILAWAKANPQVSVAYDVQMPDGSRADSTAASLDFSDATSGSFSDYMACLRYLPNVQQIDLGKSGGADELSTEQVRQLADNYSHIRLDYQIDYMGRTLTLYDESLDLSGLRSEDLDDAVNMLQLMKNLKRIELGEQSSGGLELEDIAHLAAVCPDAVFDYRFQLYGKSVSLADEVLDLSQIEVTDDGEAVKTALRYMKNCKTLDMDLCGLSDEKMAEIRGEFPNVDVIWRIWFGELYSVRTDTERILASKPTVGGILDNVQVDKLKYCTKVKYLDLGHNDAITDLSFVTHMPDLEVFIIAMNPLADLSPLASCPKLEYLELNTTAVQDLSPLSNASALRHLNISCCYGLYDISPLYGLAGLERLWIGNQTPIPAEQVQQMQAMAPGCVISTISDDPHGDGWRYTNYDINYHIYTWSPRYELLRQQIGYDYQEYSFYWLDTKCPYPAPPEYAGTYYIHESQLTGE